MGNGLFKGRDGIGEVYVYIKGKRGGVVGSGREREIERSKRGRKKRVLGTS